jgi:hypothetical protein
MYMFADSTLLHGRQVLRRVVMPVHDTGFAHDGLWRQGAGPWMYRLKTAGMHRPQPGAAAVPKGTEGPTELCPSGCGPTYS